MLDKTLVSPLRSYNYPTNFYISTPDVVTATPNIAHLNLNNLSQNAPKGTLTLSFSCKKWLLRSTLQIENMISTEEDKKTWQDCREALYAFSFSVEEADKILGKAYGQIHSPYWGEERKTVVPKIDIVKEILDYLRSLSLSDDDLCKVLKKFPEVLGCNLDVEIKTNVQLLEKEWGIKGKSLRNLLLRNPKVLGYNVDCKGDCMAQCTRCWVRF